MASMGFDQATIIELMSLVDDNKERMKEANYVKICNAMRYLHNRFTTTPSQPVQQPAELQLAELRVINIRRSIQIMERTTPVVVNAHRQQVIEEVTQQPLRGPRGGVKTLKTSEIHRLVQELISRGLIQDDSHFQDLVLAKAGEQNRSFIRIQRALLFDELNELDILQRQHPF